MATQSTRSRNLEQLKKIEDAMKLREYLTALIQSKVCQQGPTLTFYNIKELIQKIIDGEDGPEILYSPQLDASCIKQNSLPVLRQMMFYNQLEIDGINPPTVEIFKKQSVVCQIYESCSLAHSEISSKTILLESQIFRNMENFLNCEEYSDIEVHVGNEVFKCHKLVLACWSSYFSGLFSSGMSEAMSGRVKLITVDETEFRDILRVMYSGKCELSESNVQGLLYAASYLQIPFVEENCVKFIVNNIDKFSDDTHFEFLKMSNALSLNLLSSRLIYWIACRFNELNKLEMLYTHMTLDNMMELLEFPLNSSSEDEICNVALNWISADIGRRKQFSRDIISKTNYLALTRQFMIEVFLCHPVVSGNVDLTDITNRCVEYLKHPGRQHEYIGELKVASHRVGHKYVDVLAICNPTNLEFAELSKFDEGCDIGEVFRKSRNDQLHNLRRRPNSVAACNVSRTEIVVSTGTQMYYFNGETCTWSCGPFHTAPSENNCLLFNADLNCVYSVVVGNEKILIEKCDVHCNKMEVLYAENERKEIVQRRTCAYLIGGNIFILKLDAFGTVDTCTSKEKHTSIYQYNIETNSVNYIEDSDLPYVFSLASPYKEDVFLIDDGLKRVLKVSGNGSYIKTHWEMLQIPVLGLPASWKDFGGCIYKGKLILAGGTTKTIRPDFVVYKLNTHIQQALKSTGFANEPAVCLKMTICLEAVIDRSVVCSKSLFDVFLSLKDDIQPENRPIPLQGPGEFKATKVNVCCGRESA